jgi:hypothetical protein
MIGSIYVEIARKTPTTSEEKTHKQHTEIYSEIPDDK